MSADGPPAESGAAPVGESVNPGLGPLLVGAVLAGGTSRRLGRDKTAETVGGVPMIERAVGLLNAVAGAAIADVFVVSGRPDTPEGPWRVVSDERPERGPLAGIEAALREAVRLGAEGVFVLAADLPLVDAAGVRAVVEGLGSELASAPSRNGEPPFEPLCAAYRVACLEEAGALLDAGEGAAHRLFARVGGRVLPEAGGGLLNVNTEEDLRRARALAEAQETP